MAFAYCFRAKYAVPRFFRRDFQRLLVPANGAPEALARIVDRPEIIHGLDVIGLEFQRLLVTLARIVELHHLVIRDANFVEHQRVFGNFAKRVDGLAVHLASHVDVASGFGRENGFFLGKDADGK
jgi:hypothetical protein